MEEERKAWRRLNVILPANSIDERTAATSVIDRLSSSFGGITYSVTVPPVFDGWWKNKAGQWEQDSSSVAIIDAQLSYPELEEIMRLIRGIVLLAYKRCGCFQKEVWVTAHDLVGDPLDRSTAESWGFRADRT